MTSCAVKWCGKSSRHSNYKNEGITFHRFPRCPEMKSKWIDATCRGEKWFPTKNSVICSRHFMEDNFHAMKNRRRLMDSALPTLYLPLLTQNSSTATSSENISETNLLSTLAAHDTIATPKNTPTKKKRHFIALATTLSAYDSLIKKRLCRRIIELNNTVKTKNIKLRKLRSANRRLRTQVNSLKSKVAELENKK